MCAVLKQAASNVVFGILEASRTHMKQHCLDMQERVLAAHGIAIKLWFLTSTWEEVAVNLPHTATHMGKGDMEAMYENMALTGGTQCLRQSGRHRNVEDSTAASTRSS